MTKGNIINLIKYYAQNDDNSFRTEAYLIANEFSKLGDRQLSEYIITLLANGNTFSPSIYEQEMKFVKKINTNTDQLPLPDAIKNDILGIVNAAQKKIGVNKFLFSGAPGTGKTESAKQIARILNRELFSVDFSLLISSHLGQTSKNISELFKEINELKQPQKAIILFDEIDVIALDRVNSNDVREMGRATSTILKELDNLNPKIMIIATSNLVNLFDKALTRRFDFIVDFNRYSKEDLIEVAEIILNSFLNKTTDVSRNIKLFRKILSVCNTIPYPGDLKNIIKTSIAFSELKSEFDYLKRIYNHFQNTATPDLKTLQNQGFTLREIEILTGVSKSQVSRVLKD
ncbi:ATP-binding protein [Mycoplasma procyoni]|uniref:ATP-binding protein n=1 Tax=Mycoplasma procyoni TaxID=568784 RepID=UPI00197BC408|nr:ATP-binding protein [Mycoplasma procyoni]MBN3535127.1 AAA family ATPase [Mycoplasma procyoni]